MIRVEITPGSIAILQDDYVLYESLTELSLSSPRSVIMDIDQLTELVRELTDDEVILTEEAYE
jgi:hypothetical protein